VNNKKLVPIVEKDFKVCHHIT